MKLHQFFVFSPYGRTAVINFAAPETQPIRAVKGDALAAYIAAQVESGNFESPEDSEGYSLEYVNTLDLETLQIGAIDSISLD